MQTILTNYYQRIISREIIKNIFCKLLPEKSLQTILKTFIKESFLTKTIYICIYHYQRNHFQQILQTTTREIIPNNTYKPLPQKIIPNNTYKLLPEKSLQTMLKKVYQTTQFIPNNTSYL